MVGLAALIVANACCALVRSPDLSALLSALSSFWNCWRGAELACVAHAEALALPALMLMTMVGLVGVYR